MKAKQLMALVMFIGCLSLAVYSIASKDKEITNKALALVGMVVTGYFGKELAGEDVATNE